MSSLVPRPHSAFRCLQYVQFFARVQREPGNEAMLWALSILAPFSISSFTMSSRPWYAAQCKAVPPSLLSLQWSTLRRWLFSHFWTWCVYPPLIDICNSKKIKWCFNSAYTIALHTKGLFTWLLLISCHDNTFFHLQNWEASLLSLIQPHVHTAMGSYS